MVHPQRSMPARLETEYPCCLVFGGESREASLRQISRRLADVFVADLRSGASGEAELAVDDLRLRGEIVDTRSEAGGARVVLRFGPLSDSDVTRLSGLLDTVLLAGGGRGRRHPRVALRADVTCSTPQQVRGVMCDLSQGGLGLETTTRLDEGETVRVNVQLGGFPQRLSLEGRVMHVREIGSDRFVAGLRFEELAPDRKDVLRDLIQFLVRPDP